MLSFILCKAHGPIEPGTYNLPGSMGPPVKLLFSIIFIGKHYKSGNP